MTSIASLVVSSLYEITLDVIFDGDLLSQDANTNPTNYSFTGDMYVRYVEQLNTTTIRLWVENFTGTDTYTLSVSGLKDSLNADIEDSVNFSRASSGATFNAHNNLIRTSQDGYHISYDSERTYFGSSKGIDILDNNGSIDSSQTWGQIFTNNKISAMFVADFGTTYSFSDTSRPVLSSLSPANLDEVSGDTNISFRLSDIGTSVRTTDLSVYVNNVLAFEGVSGGFKNGYSGNIQVGYKYLDVVINPDSNFPSGSVVNINVVAEDLLENTIDEEYYFTIVTLLTGSGFGDAPVGTSSFGGI